MRTLLRLLWPAVLIPAVPLAGSFLVGFATLSRDPSSCTSPDAHGGSPVPTTFQEWNEADERHRAELLRVHDRLVARQDIIAELLAHRLTFSEAVARFREVDVGMPEEIKAIARAQSGCSTEEGRLALAVVFWLRGALVGQKDMDPDFRACLQAEVDDSARRPARAIGR